MYVRTIETPEILEKGPVRTGYSIQAGAFSKLDNAVRLTRMLEGRGIKAYYFLDKSGLYKVRFGDFPSREKARSEAARVRAAGEISGYYIIGPEEYAAAKERSYGSRHLRDELVETAKSFIGLPYRWGGESPDGGVDCSGLTMAVYHLNGLSLPRTSYAQYKVGKAVGRSELKRGDLVFFSTTGARKVSHVGMYMGGDTFVHAPGKGKQIRTESLANSYYRNCYAGARTYLW